MIRLKRAYDRADPSDGLRVLVDRLWPRGLSKEAAGVDLWLRDVAPSDGLRRWFGHRPERWEEFRRRYRQELASGPGQEALRTLASRARGGDVTLLYGAKDTRHNGAVVLKELLEGMQGVAPTGEE